MGWLFKAKSSTASTAPSIFHVDHDAEDFLFEVFGQRSDIPFEEALARFHECPVPGGYICWSIQVLLDPEATSDELLEDKLGFPKLRVRFETCG